MNGLCTGVGWHKEGLAFELRQEAEKSLYNVTVGDEIALSIEDPRQCIGYRPPDAESLIPCPHDSHGISAAQCASCFQEAHILPCLRCTGERCSNPVRRNSCVQPDNHAVYLASFGPGVVKVGVARWGRRFERLAEQGARAAIIVACDDGQQVRRVESQFRFTDIDDRLSPTEKLQAYTQAGSQEELVKELHEVLKVSKIRVDGKWLNEPETVDLPEMPVLKRMPRLLRPKSGFRVRGTIFAICGQALIIDSDIGDQVAVEANSLIGYQVKTLATDESGEGQLALALD